MFVTREMFDQASWYLCAGYDRTLDALIPPDGAVLTLTSVWEADISVERKIVLGIWLGMFDDAVLAAFAERTWARIVTQYRMGFDEQDRPWHGDMARRALTAHFEGWVSARSIGEAWEPVVEREYRAQYELLRELAA